jgi:hypothetical protein
MEKKAGLNGQKSAQKCQCQSRALESGGGGRMDSISSRKLRVTQFISSRYSLQD